MNDTRKHNYAIQWAVREEEHDCDPIIRVLQIKEIVIHFFLGYWFFKNKILNKKTPFLINSKIRIALLRL